MKYTWILSNLEIGSFGVAYIKNISWNEKWMINIQIQNELVGSDYKVKIINKKKILIIGYIMWRFEVE